MTDATQAPTEILDEVRLLAEAASGMHTERELRRRLQRIAGEIRLWQSEQQVSALRQSRSTEHADLRDRDGR